MGISLSIEKLLFDFIANKRDRQLRTADYLDEIAVEAMELVKIWRLYLLSAKFETHDTSHPSKSQSDRNQNAVQSQRDKKIDNKTNKLKHSKIPNKGMFWDRVAFGTLPAGVRVQNDAPAAMLKSYYKSVSKVLGERHKNELNFIVFRLGGLLKQRDLGKETIETFLAEVNSIKDVDNLTRGVVGHRIRLEDVLSLMLEEASEIKVFAKEFRAKIK